MTNCWWHINNPVSQAAGRAAPDALPATIRRGVALEFRDPPATVLRLPPVLQMGDATRRSLWHEAGAISCDYRSQGLTIGTAGHQRGLVKLWKARSVDLRHLLLAAPARLHSPAAPVAAPHGATATSSARGLPGMGVPLAGRAWQEADETFNQRPGLGSKGPTQTGSPSVISPHALLARRLAAILQPPPETLLRADGPLEWPGRFFPYQQEGIRVLLHSDHLLLGDDLGLGKTVQAIAALRLLLHRREMERALIVAPASLLDQWHRELAHWAPELRIMRVQGGGEDRLWQWQYRAHVTLTSYETLRADCTSSPHCGPRREVWGAVVLDEAQKIKNRDTSIARACRNLPRQRSWALTGTPLENRIQDTASILEFVRGDGQSPVHPVPTFGPSLQASLRECQLRRRKADVLPDLPPKITTELLLPLTPAQRRAYDSIEKEALQTLRHTASDGDVSLTGMLEQITRLKQICNFAPGSASQPDAAASRIGASAKLEDLGNRLEELSAAGHKALVFTQYTNETNGARRIAAGLQKFSPLLYTGDMSLRARNEVVQRFQQDDTHRVLILSVQAGGQGLNLQAASYVFHFDRWWNPALELQADGRAHRLGQSQPVHVYKYIMADTIEQRIDEALKRKAQLFEEWVDDTSLDLSHLLDKRDLTALVGLDLGATPDDEVDAAENLPGLALEQQVVELLMRQGYQLQQTAMSYDAGVDVIAEKADAVGTRTRLFIQCKDTARPAGVDVVRNLNGVLPAHERGTSGVVVCPAGFTAEARTFAFARDIQLWDAAKLHLLAGAAK